MDTLHILILLMGMAVILVEVALKLGIPYPILLIAGGALISFIPGTQNVNLEPNLILLLVLPPILYYTAFWISNREFIKNIREIVSLALGLVVVTTVLIAVLFKFFFPELPWALAFVFGALISPPDATASKAILRRFSLSPRLSNVLEGESLVNDATGIVLYKLALTAFASGGFSLMEFGNDFLVNSIGGVALGIALGLAMQHFSSYFLGPIIAVVFSFTIPYVTYVIADYLGVSGVLAVVMNGLIGSHVVISNQVARRRVVGFAAWDVWFIILNCFVFVMIGVQLRQITAEMSLDVLLKYSLYGVIITAAIIGVRFIWIYLYKGLVNWKKGAFWRTLAFKEGTIMGWSGMRGIVSLALALALPFDLPDNARSIILFLTFVVILLTLMMTGLSLPFVIRKLKIPLFKSESPTLMGIRKRLKQLANEKIQELDIEDIHKKFLDSYFHTHHTILENSMDESKAKLEKARLEVISFQRNFLIELWKNEEVEDHELAILQQELDLEITHFTRGEID